MQKQKSGFTPALLIFLVLSQQIGWQGYGQVNRTVVDTIMDYINTNVSSHTGDSSYDAFNTAFSTELNRRWDPAWNVFTIKTTSAFDTIVYGYAYKNQWMWYNDYRVNGVVLAFVIWKDYNCNVWKTVGKNGAASGFEDVSSLQGSNMEMHIEYNDLWTQAKSIADSMFVDGPFSVIASQDKNSDFYGRICVLENNFYYHRKDNSGQRLFIDSQDQEWGNMFLFKTRNIVF